MPRVLPALFLLAAAAVLAASASSFGEDKPQPADPFNTKLDEALGQLATYDVGSSTAPLGTVAELIAATAGKPDQRKHLAAKLAAVLSSGAPQGAKGFVCRQLALIGTADQVPALATLLADDKLSHMARYALERIPSPAADDALRGALGQLKGKLLIGVINSLGNRKSSAAVAELSGLVGDADSAVASAAAEALGKIGPPAASALEQALAKAPAAVQPAVLDACLLCADALMAQGQRVQAAAMYDRLRTGNVPKACRIAATRGAILAREAAGAAILVEQLQGTDPALFGLALSLIRYQPIVEFTAAAAAQLANLPPDKQTRLIEALADRGDKAAAPAVLRLAKEGDAAVRPVALAALGKLGGAASVPLLLEIASGEDAAGAQAAMASLAAMADKDVDRTLLDALEKAEGKVRPLVISLLGQRRVAAATPALLKAAAEADPAVRQAAIQALAFTAGPQDVGALVELLVKAKEPQQLAAAEAMLGTACARMPDRDAIASALAGALPQAEVPCKAALIRSLGQVAGAKALAAVQAAVKDSNENVADTAVRVLADWQEPAAAPELLGLAKTTTNRKYKILALRGYLRLVGHRDLTAAQKLAMCQEAMPLAERPEEKRLVLGALGGVQHPDALAMVVPGLDDPALKNEAAVAALAIGERIAGSHPTQVGPAVKKVLAVVENPELQKRAKELLERIGQK